MGCGVRGHHEVDGGNIEGHETAGVRAVCHPGTSWMITVYPIFLTKDKRRETREKDRSRERPGGKDNRDTER